MASFDTEAVFEAVVDSSSLRSARDKIESELGDVEVQVTAQTGSSGGGKAPRDRAMSRRLQDQQLDALDEGLGLDEERNRLLEQLVDSQEQDTYNRASGGRGGMGSALGMLGGIAGLGMAGIVGAVSGAGGGMDLSPSDVVSPADLVPTDVVSPASLSPGAVIGTAAEVGAGNVIAAGAALSPSAVISSAATLAATDVVAEQASLTPGDLIETPAGVSATDVVADGATVATSGVVASAASVTASALVSGAASISPGDVIGDVPNISIQDLVQLATTATTSVPQAAADAAGGGDGPLAGLDVGAGEVAGGLGAAGSAGVLGKLLSGAGKAGGGAASFAALPSIIAAQSAQRSQNQPEDQQSWFDKHVGSVLAEAGSDGGQFSGPAMTMGTNFASMFPTEDQDSSTDPGRQRGGQSATFEHSPTYEVDLSELERQQRQELQELKRRIGRVENALSRR